jgi:hypothetical protein
MPLVRSVLIRALRASGARSAPAGGELSGYRPRFPARGLASPARGQGTWLAAGLAVQSARCPLGQKKTCAPPGERTDPPGPALR